MTVLERASNHQPSTWFTTSLKMEAVDFSETFVPVYQIIRCHIPDYNIYSDAHFCGETDTMKAQKL
jgi:hypothetical protein